MVVPLQLGIPGTQEMMIILLIAVLLFGANKIPKLARSTGQAMGEFQRGREEIEQELEEVKSGASASTDTTSDSTADTTTESSTETDTETSTETTEE